MDVSKHCESYETLKELASFYGGDATVRPMAHDPSSTPKNWFQNLVQETGIVCHAFWLDRMISRIYDHRGFYRSCAVILGYHRDFA